MEDRARKVKEDSLRLSTPCWKCVVRLSCPSVNTPCSYIGIFCSDATSASDDSLVVRLEAKWAKEEEHVHP